MLSIFSTEFFSIDYYLLVQLSAIDDIFLIS